MAAYAKMFVLMFLTVLGMAVADPGFSPGGAPTPKIAIIFHIFAENCVKMKEFGPPGGARVPGAPPWIRQCMELLFCGVLNHLTAVKIMHYVPFTK